MFKITRCRGVAKRYVALDCVISKTNYIFKYSCLYDISYIECATAYFIIEHKNIQSTLTDFTTFSYHCYHFYIIIIKILIKIISKLGVDDSLR